MRCTEGQKGAEGIPSTPFKPTLKKGLWSPEEDQKLVNYIIKNGNLGSWTYVAKQAGLQRCGKSCRLRWTNYLRPGLKHGAFSYQEERLIVHLQSILGNRWSVMAAHLPGRTDNGLKNYWNSTIKKKLNSKDHLSPSSSTNSHTKSNIPSQSNINSMSAHAHNFTSSHPSQQYLNVLPQAFQPPSNAFNVVMNGENRLCVPSVLEVKHEELKDQSDHRFSIDLQSTNSHQISYPNMWMNASSTQTNESFPSPAALISPKPLTCDQLIIEPRRTTLGPNEPPNEPPRFPEFSLGSTGGHIPALVESKLLNEKLWNNENHIMTDHSNVWSAATHPYSNETCNRSDAFDAGNFINYDAGISTLEKHGSLYENTIHQSCHTLDPCYQFRWFVSEIQSENDRKDPINLSYDANLGIPTYIDVNSRFKSYQLPPIEEAMEINPTPTLLGRGDGNGLFQTECKDEAAQVTACAYDEMYNINPAAPCDQIYFT